MNAVAEIAAELASLRAERAELVAALTAIAELIGGRHPLDTASWETIAVVQMDLARQALAKVQQQ